jgi:hypothetical protein
MSREGGCGGGGIAGRSGGGGLSESMLWVGMRAREQWEQWERDGGAGEEQMLLGQIPLSEAALTCLGCTEPHLRHPKM